MENFYVFYHVTQNEIKKSFVIWINLWLDTKVRFHEVWKIENKFNNKIVGEMITDQLDVILLAYSFKNNYFKLSF